MLNGIIKYRPTNLCVVYLEPRRIEILEAGRHWRSWEIGSPEQVHVPKGESVFEHLQYLNLKPRVRKGSALLAIVSSVFYSVHTEHYPLTIKDHLEEAISFDWQENIFQEQDSTLHFFGPPVPLSQHVSVPIFSIQREIYDKLHQTLNGSLFNTFAVVPSALSFSNLLPLTDAGEGESVIIARGLDEENVEMHRFHGGTLLDSTVVGKSSQSMKLFRENLKCLGNGECEPHIHLACAVGEAKSQSPADVLKKAGLPVEEIDVPEPFVTGWLRGFLKQDAIHTFDSEILLKPWQVPRIVAPLAVLIFIFVLYGFYQSRSVDSLDKTSKGLKVQINQLETRWKPIEELQTRIAKFQEDQKTLSEFNRGDYQLLELLTFLTQITPDDTWLNYLSLRSGQLILRGESKSALKYLADLSKTDGLTDVKFASPVTRDPGTDEERFNVQLQLDMEKLKKNYDSLPPEPPGASAGDGQAPAVEKGIVEGSSVPGDQEVNGPEQGETADDHPPEEGQQ